MSVTFSPQNGAQHAGSVEHLLHPRRRRRERGRAPLPPSRRRLGSRAAAAADGDATAGEQPPAASQPHVGRRPDALPRRRHRRPRPTDALQLAEAEPGYAHVLD